MFNVADVVLRAEQALVKNQSNPEGTPYCISSIDINAEF